MRSPATPSLGFSPKPTYDHLAPAFPVRTVTSIYAARPSAAMLAEPPRLVKLVAGCANTDYGSDR
jgi:hypothetical protein